MRSVIVLMLAVLSGCASAPSRSTGEIAADTDRCASFSRENLQTRSLLVAYRLHCVKDTPLGL